MSVEPKDRIGEVQSDIEEIAGAVWHALGAVDSEQSEDNIEEAEHELRRMATAVEGAVQLLAELRSAGGDDDDDDDEQGESR